MIARIALGVALAVFVAVAIAWLAGAFERKIEDGRPTHGAVAAGRVLGGREVATVRTVTVPRVELAVGSVRAVHQTAVASRILASVREILVRTGDDVAEGQIVARLDDQALASAVQEAAAQVDAARALVERATDDLERSRSLLASGVATRQEVDDAQTAVRTAASRAEGAERVHEQARLALDYATLRAPMAGIVIERNVEPGDMATPGRAVVTLYDPTRMQLVAGVRETVSGGIAVGDSLVVHIDALDLTCRGTVSEIVPRASETSRTVDVKVTGPCPEGVYSGMFGRLEIPLGSEDVLVVGARAVQSVGQLRLVDVVHGEASEARLARRAIQTGRRFGDDVEVLAGLRAGERVAVPE